MIINAPYHKPRSEIRTVPVTSAMQGTQVASAIPPDSPDSKGLSALRLWPWAVMILVWWLVSALLFATTSYYMRLARGAEVTWLEAARVPFFGQTVLALTALVAIAAAWRLPLDKGRWRRSIPIHIALAVVALVARALIYHTLGQHVDWMQDLPIWRRLQAMPVNFLIYSTLVGVGYGLAYYYRYREQEVRTAQLQADLARTQLQALRVQLQPRFLFATLRGISSLMHKDVRAADRVLARLGDLLRLTLERRGVEEVTLREELDFLQLYMEVEQGRLGDRISIDYDIEPAALDAKVPHFILQPLVEGATQQGSGPLTAGTRIEVRAQCRNGSLFLRVCNYDPGVQSSSPARAGNDQASHLEEEYPFELANTRTRLEQIYSTDQQMELVDAPDFGRMISVTIPFRSGGRAEDLAPGKICR